MKNINWYFLGETVVILLLLFIIGGLLNEEQVIAKEKKTKVQDIEIVIEKDFTENKEDDFVQYIEEEESEIQVTEQQTESEEMTCSVPEETKEQELQVVQTIEDSSLDIVVFGDSIWNEGRGTDGISENLMNLTGAFVYNCAVGGTSAAVEEDLSTNVRYDWKSPSLNGLVYVANGELEAECILAEKEAYSVINEVDFEKIDYFIIAYGLNDFFSEIDIYPEDMYDMTTYVGALRHGIVKLKENYPSAKIILASPTYSEAFAGEKEENLEEYAKAAKNVAEEYGTYFLDMYYGLGINAETKEQYLSDGVHLTPAGRELYANVVANLIQSLEN